MASCTTSFLQFIGSHITTREEKGKWYSDAYWERGMKTFPTRTHSMSLQEESVSLSTVCVCHLSERSSCSPQCFVFWRAKYVRERDMLANAPNINNSSSIRRCIHQLWIIQRGKNVTGSTVRGKKLTPHQSCACRAFSIEEPRSFPGPFLLGMPQEGAHTLSALISIKEESTCCISWREAAIFNSAMLLGEDLSFPQHCLQGISQTGTHTSTSALLLQAHLDYMLSILLRQDEALTGARSLGRGRCISLLLSGLWEELHQPSTPPPYIQDS